MSPTGISRQNLQIQIIVGKFLQYLYVAGGEGGFVGGNIIFGDCFKEAEADGEAYFIQDFVHGSAQSLTTIVDVHHSATKALSMKETSVEAVASYLAVRFISQYIGKKRPVLL